MLLKDRIVCVTGASSGIGEAAARRFAEQGARLLLCARRIDRLESLANNLSNQYGTQILIHPLDVRERSAVESWIASLPESWRNIYLLLNNAGLALARDSLQQGIPENWDTMIDTNIKGLLYMTRAILPLMLERGEGHVMNIGSVAGQECYPQGNVYAATKHAVRAISKSLRLDLLGTPIRVTEIAPGAVETEFSTVRFHDAEAARKFYADFTPLSADDIADAILWAATRPPHVCVAEVTIFPTAQASANYLHRGNFK